MAAYLNRIATAVPPHEVHGRFLALAPDLLPDERSRRLFRRMAERCGIARRWSFLPPGDGESIDAEGFYRHGGFPDTAARMRFFERHAPDLAEQAVRRLEIVPRRISHLIVASCTGLYAPGLDLDLAGRLGLAGDIERSVVGFMGCHAALTVLRQARHIVRSQPDAQVLVVMTELCTLHLQESADLETVLSFLIFGDGCAAGLVSAEPTGLALDGFRTAVLPDTAGLITWRIGNQGFDMHLGGAVPSCLGAGLPSALGDTAGVELWAVHPGGRSVLDAVEQGLGLAPQALDDSRAVLRDFGNMSSATVMFVLQRMMAQPGSGRGLAMAFGPGLTAEVMDFRRMG